MSRSGQVAQRPICTARSCQVRYLSRTKVSRNNSTCYNIVKRVNNRMLNIVVPGFVCFPVVLSIGQGSVMIADKLLLTAFGPLYRPATLLPLVLPLNSHVMAPQFWNIVCHLGSFVPSSSSQPRRPIFLYKQTLYLSIKLNLILSKTKTRLLLLWFPFPTLH